MPARAHGEAQARAAVQAPLPEHSRVAASPEQALVTLEQLLAFADEHSPVLAVARSTRARVEAAEAAAAVWGLGNPTLSLAVGPRTGSQGTGLDVEAGLMQPLRIAGERGARREAAGRLEDLTTAEIEQVRWAVHCDVHAGFHRAMIEYERSRLAERVVTFQREVLSVVERQIAAGETARLTLRLAQAEVAQAEQVLALANQGFLVARIRLAKLSGWPLGSPPLPAGSVDLPHDPPSFERLRVAARAHLPSLRVAEARIREAEARRKAAARAGWPSPSLGVSYRREGNPGAEGPSDIVLGAIALPIPAFQTNQAERVGAKADVEIADAERFAIEALIDAQVAEARSEVAAAAARTRAYGTEILPRFEENLTLLKRSLELGEIDILALSTGRERFLRIQSDALAAQLDYFVALSTLERVVGVDLVHDDHPTLEKTSP